MTIGIASGRNGRRDLRWMVAIVVDERDSADLGIDDAQHL